MATLKRITIEGYKSIKKMNLDLGPRTILIGANGSGKSNFLSFFTLLAAVANNRVALEVERAGGAHALLHHGPKVTSRTLGQTWFETPEGRYTHWFALAFAAGDRLIPEGDLLVPDGEHFARPLPPGEAGRDIHAVCGSGGFSRPTDGTPASPDAPAAQIQALVEQLQLYHFHDTSFNSPLRLTATIEDNHRLHADGGNLPAVLYKLRQVRPVAYRRVVGTLRQIVPPFDDFVLAPRELNPDTILLQWRERSSDYVFGPHQVSDGTLRAIALVTLLSQGKDDLPRMLLLDEPELGLHPAAINVIGGLLRSASHHCQVIVATQSAALVEGFEPEDVVVVDRDNGQSTFKRQDVAELADWLKDYTLGQLWEKNVFGGGPFA
jgi:predicted ATPase